MRRRVRLLARGNSPSRLRAARLQLTPPLLLTAGSSPDRRIRVLGRATCDSVDRPPSVPARSAPVLARVRQSANPPALSPAVRQGGTGARARLAQCAKRS